MIQQLETTMRSGAVPQAPQFRPSAQVQSSQPTVNVNKALASSGHNTTTAVVSLKEGAEKVKSEEQFAKVTESKTDNTIPPAVKPAGGQESSCLSRVEGDLLGDARSKVQEEIGIEFAAIMATGTLRASEAAALATRRVMQRYGHMNAGQS